MVENQEILMKKAQNGNSDAMLELGLYELFINKNYDNSLDWLHKSYDNGNNHAAFGLVMLYSEINNECMYYWGNVVLENFGDHYSKEEDNFSLWSCIPQIVKEKKCKIGNNYSVSSSIKKDKNKLEIGIRYKQNHILKSITYPLSQLIENKYIYNEEIEKDINHIQLYEDSDKVVSMLELVYKDTLYPGALYALGEIYFYGYNDMNRNEKIGMEYFEKASREGYKLASSTLCSIYLGNASKNIYKAFRLYDKNDADDKAMIGNCLIADYFIGDAHHNHYDQYFEGLEKLVEASHEGCEKATFILNVMGKDKLNKRTYKKGLEKEKKKFSNYLDCYYGIDSYMEYDDIEFEDFDYEDIDDIE